MIYRRRRKFKKSFAELPHDIQEKTFKAFELFKGNPQHPSLRIKKMKLPGDIWEGRKDDFYRFTFEYVTGEQGETICYFRNIGRHDILDHSP
jgi:hypothetical protein